MSMGAEGCAPKGIIPTVLSCFAPGAHAPGVTAPLHAHAGEFDVASALEAPQPPQPHFSSSSRIPPPAGTGLSLTPLPSNARDKIS